MPNSFLVSLAWNSSGELARDDFEQVLSALLKISDLTTDDFFLAERPTAQVSQRNYLVAFQNGNLLKT